MFTSVVAVCFTYILWSIWMQTDVDPASLTNWSDVSWQIAQVDSRGRLVRLGSHPMALAILFGLVSLCFTSFTIGAWQFFTGNEFTRKDDNEATSERLEKVGQELDNEVFGIVRMLKQHIEFSGSHTEVLAKVNKSLSTLNTADQIRAIVQLLLTENVKVQS